MDRVISILMGLGFVIFMFTMLLLWLLPFGSLLVAFILVKLAGSKPQEEMTV